MHLRRFFLIFIPVLLVLSGGGAFCYWQQQNSEKSSTNNLLLSDSIAGEKTDDLLFFPPPLREIGEPPAFHESLLTGLARTSGDPEKILGVMIDEAPAARPLHRGIEYARIVFEAPAEGGIPRLLALFSSDDFPEKVGPVRSARHYFVQMAEPIAGAYAHAGGSPLGLEEVYQSSLLNIDEGFNDTRFERDTTIARPHNLFLLPKMVEEDIPPSSQEKAIFFFSDEIPQNEEAAPVLEIDFSTEQHSVSWQYNSEKGCYQRKQQLETSDVCVENVIVIVTSIWHIEGDEKGRLDMTNTGKGIATVFRDGKAFPGTWSRKAGEIFHLFNESQEEIPLKPGKSFFEIIGSEEQFSFSSPG